MMLILNLLLFISGDRMIVVHAGGSDGFIPGDLLTFKSGCSTGDYHNDMNADNFTRWLREQLIPNLPDKSVVVLDNAAYHNIQIDRSIFVILLFFIKHTYCRFLVCSFETFPCMVALTRINL